jgi:hypothetical protein
LAGKERQFFRLICHTLSVKIKAANTLMKEFISEFAAILFTQGRQELNQVSKVKTPFASASTSLFFPT